MNKTSSLLLSIALGLGAAAHAQAPAQPPPPRVVSPEVAADGKVTFRIRAAEEETVALTSGGDLPQIPFQQTLPLAKGPDGVWSLTLSRRASAPVAGSRENAARAECPTFGWMPS